MHMKPSLSLVGAGRAGRSLARALRSKGWRIGAVVTRSLATARAAVRAIGGGIANGELTPAVLKSDVILLATPDDAMPGVAALLARLRQSAEIGWTGKVVLHTSGALDHKVLEPVRKHGAATGSMHPMQTFGGSAPNLRGVLFGIEGDPRARRMAQRIARELRGIPIVVPAGRKAAYHAAAVMVAGLGMGLLESAVVVLTSAGFTRERAMRSLWVLLRQMLDDAERIGTRRAWAGPLVREDFGVIRMHHRALQAFPAEFQELYAALARVAGRTLKANPAPFMRKLNAALAAGKTRKRGTR